MIRSTRTVPTILILAALAAAPASAGGNGPLIDVWYGTNQSFGQLGRPQQWVNILGNVSDPDGVASLTYSVNGGPAVTMGLGPDTRRLQRPGDFNADIDADVLNDGANSVLLTATDGLGNVSTQTVTVNYTRGTAWPTSYQIDWPTVATLEDAVQVVDGLWTFDATGVRPVEVGYDRIVAVGDIAWGAYEITVPLTVHAIDPNGFQFPSVAPGVGIVLRWRGHTDFGGNWQPIYGWLPNGGTFWYDYGAANGGEFQISGEQGLFTTDPNDHKMQLGVTVNLKFRVEPIDTDTALYSAKVWPDGSPEPAGWALQGIDGPGDLPTGSLLLVAHHVDATFGNVTVTPLPSPIPPIVSNVTTSADQTTATVYWSTNEPTSSTIAWGLTSGLELGTASDPNATIAHQAVLTGLTPGTTYFYQITATDDANDVGTSGTLSFVTRGGGPGFVSDDFSAPALDPNVWTLVDPRGDTAVTLTGRQLSLAMPAGTPHDVWTTGINAPRAMQDVQDTDFEIEAKFDSQLSQRYQGQGILIEQDPNTVLRFDVFSDGTSIFAFAALVDGATADPKFSQLISTDGRVRLRVTRTGDVWEMRYSNDGQVWTLAGSFTQAMTVTKAGVFGLNSADAGQSAPAHTALVDYAFSTDSPIVPEDGGKVALSIVVSGNGSVTRDPNLALYDANTPITLTAVPEAGWQFDGWGGDIHDANNPVVISLRDDAIISATFSQIGDPNPPVISNLSVVPSDTSAVITWDTDEPATTGYRYGLTPAFELGSGEDLALVTSHQVVLAGLDPNTTYQYEIFSADAATNTTTVGGSFGTSPPPVSTIHSDDFSAGVLDPNLWTYIDPLGDSTLTVNGAQVIIDVPGGVEHPVWIGGNFAPRIMQPANDADFQVEIKYESLPDQAFQVQGLIVEQDPNNYIRINFQSDGITASVFAATFTAGAPTIRFIHAISSIVPQWLRVTRTGDDWVIEYSFDRVTWTLAGQFTHSLVVTTVGPFVGNEETALPAPAFRGVIDYFFNTASPIDPEDGGLHTITIGTVGSGSVLRSPDQTLYAPGTPVQLTAVPAVGWDFAGWSGDISGPNNPISVTTDSDLIATATFTQADMTPPVISNLAVLTTASSATITFDTDEPATGRVAYGLTAALELGTVTEPAAVTSHSITLSGLDPNTTYFYEAFATDASSNESSTGQMTFTTDALIVSNLISDDFDGAALDPNVWTFVNPLGDATLSVGGSAVTIDIPAGPPHDLWIDGDFAPRIMQATNNADFEVVAKYSSVVSAQFQIQGLVVEQDPNTFLRFNVHYDGFGVVVFAATIRAGQADVHLSRSLGSGTPAYLRVNRNGDTWTFSHSPDGVTWTDETPFVSALKVTSVGPIIGNSNVSGNDAPAFTGVIDSFENTASPLATRHKLTVIPLGGGTVLVDPLYPDYTAGTVVTLTPVPDVGWAFRKWTGAVSSTDVPLAVTITGDMTIKARFRRTGPWVRPGGEPSKYPWP